MSVPELGALPGPGERWGILGGSFDPPHFGHLRLAESLQEAAGLDGVLFIPTYHPPHKIQPIASFDQRAEMVELSTRPVPTFAVSAIERTLTTPSYTVNTLKALRDSFPGARIYLLIGADNLDILNNWVEIEKVLALAPALIGRRPGAVGEIPERLRNQVRVYQTELTDISSTQIREAVRNEAPLERLAPQSVIEYIERHGLYRN